MKRASIILASIIVLATTLGTILTACSGSESDGAYIPRRAGYPRIPLPDSTYHAADSLPLHFEVNDLTTVTLVDHSESDNPGARWINVVYPTLGNSVIFCTFTPVQDEEQRRHVLDNRLERIALNAGSNTSEIIELESAGAFHAHVVVTPTGTVTPIQFLAYDRGWVVTGAYYLEAANSAPADSLTPVVESVRGDIIHAMQTLRRP